MPATPIAEQRLFCYRMASAVAQTQLSADRIGDADRLFLWCQAQSEPNLAFQVLQTIDQLRTGVMSIDRILTNAGEAYSFALDKKERVVPEAPRTARVRVGDSISRSETPKERILPAGSKKRSRKKGSSPKSK